MTYMPRMNRRAFVIGATAAGGGFALGFALPYGPQAAHAADAPEINAWVVIKPDDTVVVRVARSEMGQGTLTGLAQLVAEELDCDWSKVATELVTPGQNLAPSASGATCNRPEAKASASRMNMSVRAAPPPARC